MCIPGSTHTSLVKIHQNFREWSERWKIVFWATDSSWSRTVAMWSSDIKQLPQMVWHRIIFSNFCFKLCSRTERWPRRRMNTCALWAGHMHCKNALTGSFLNNAMIIFQCFFDKSSWGFFVAFRHVFLPPLMMFSRNTIMPFVSVEFLGGGTKFSWNKRPIIKCPWIHRVLFSPLRIQCKSFFPVLFELSDD